MDNFGILFILNCINAYIENLKSFSNEPGNSCLLVLLDFLHGHVFYGILIYYNKVSSQRFQLLTLFFNDPIFSRATIYFLDTLQTILEPNRTQNFIFRQARKYNIYKINILTSR